MLGLFLSAGIGAANVYFAGSRRFGIASLTRNSVVFAILGSIVGAIVLLVLVVGGALDRLVPGVPIGLVVLAMAGLPAALLAGYCRTILTGLQRIITVNVLGLLLEGLTLVLTVFLVIVFRMGPVGGVLACLGTGAAGVIAMGAVLHREGAVFRPQWDISVIRPILSYGLRGHVGNVLQFFNYRLDVFIVNYFLGPAGVGVYGVSVGLAELLWYLPNAVGFVIFPKAAASKPEEMNAFTPRVFRLTLLLTAFGGAGLALFAKPLIKLIYSSAFAGAYVPMLALLPGAVLLGAGKVLTNEIAGRGYPHYNSINAGVALVLTVALDLLLIPRYGILGAAVASSVAYSAIFVTAVVFYRTVSRKTSQRSASFSAPVGNRNS
jgi:O-antigen/teichoic acid export membrane protein